MGHHTSSKASHKPRSHSSQSQEGQQLFLRSYGGPENRFRRPCPGPTVIIMVMITAPPWPHAKVTRPPLPPCVTPRHPPSCKPPPRPCNNDRGKLHVSTFNAARQQEWHCPPGVQPSRSIHYDSYTECMERSTYTKLPPLQKTGATTLHLRHVTCVGRYCDMGAKSRHLRELAAVNCHSCPSGAARKLSL